MCVILAPKEVGARPTLEMLKTAERRNGDGGGVAWSQDGAVRWKKGIGAEEIHKILSEIPQDASWAAHFRIATVGEKGPALCHPFPITRKSEVAPEGAAEAVLFHNGHLNDWRKWLEINSLRTGYVLEGPISDSRVMAWLTAYMTVRAIDLLGGTSKFLVLNKDGRIGIWPTDKASWLETGSILHSASLEYSNAGGRSVYGTEYTEWEAMDSGKAPAPDASPSGAVTQVGSPQERFCGDATSKSARSTRGSKVWIRRREGTGAGSRGWGTGLASSVANWKPDEYGRRYSEDEKGNLSLLIEDGDVVVNTSGAVWRYDRDHWSYLGVRYKDKHLQSAGYPSGADDVAKAPVSPHAPALGYPTLWPADWEPTEVYVEETKEENGTKVARHFTRRVDRDQAYVFPDEEAQYVLVQHKELRDKNGKAVRSFCALSESKPEHSQTGQQRLGWFEWSPPRLCW